MKYKSFSNLKAFNNARCKKPLMPLNLQFFAESGDNEGQDSIDGAAGGNTGNDNTPPMSFDDFLKDPKNQSEFDKRVNKALETNKIKIEADYQKRIEDAQTEAAKLAKMNAEEKARYESEKRENELKQREAEITRRELTATAKEQLAEKGLPIVLSEVLNYNSAEECNNSIAAVEKAFTEAVEKSVESRLSGKEAPKKAPEGTTFTREQIEAMTPAEINANWDAVQQVLRQG